MLVLPYDAASFMRRRPTAVYVNNYSKVPIYDVDFGGGAAARVIPHNTGDHVLIWPRPPRFDGGVEVFFTGPAAWRVASLEDDDPWWEGMHRLSQ